MGSDRGWRDVALIEGFGKETESNEGAETSTPAFRALRSEDILYTEYETGERELYNLRKDPYQTANIARDVPKSLLREHSRQLNALATCAGPECARLENDPIAKRSAAAGNGDDKENSSSKKKGKHRRGKQEQRRSNQIAASQDRAQKSDVAESRPRRVSGGARAESDQRDRHQRVKREDRRQSEQRDNPARRDERRLRR
jgi:hypothetical protein